MELIKEIRTVEYFDKRRYKFTFTNNEVRYIPSVTTKLEEYREQGLEYYRERVGTEEADRAMEEGGEWGGIVHHGCFLLATGGAVLYEPPSYQTIGIANEDVADLVKQNTLIRQQLDAKGIPYLTINDQFRFLQARKFKFWMDTVKPKVLFAETVVYSLAHDIAGRIDFLFEIQEGNYPIAGVKEIFLPGGIVLPDVKTGAWSDRHFLQMAAYRVAVKESLNVDVVATVGIHLKAKTNSGMNTLVRVSPEVDKDFEGFQHVAALYDRKHKNDEPQDFEFESVLLSNEARGAIPLGIVMENQTGGKQLTAHLKASVKKERKGE